MLREGIQKIISSKNKTFLAFCFCFIGGVALASFSNTNYFLPLFLIASFVVLFFVILYWSLLKAKLAMCCLLFFILGGLRFLITIPANEPSKINFYNGQKIEFIGFIEEEPDVRIDKVYYVVKTTEVTISNRPQKISGRVLVKNLLYPAYRYGDQIKIICTLQSPKINQEGNFRYDKYLAAQTIWSICGSPRITVLSSGHGYKFFELLWNGKALLGRQIEKLWSEPESSFMAGLLYGSRSGLPAELKDYFNRTGVTHIVAISGFNITIISVLLLNIFIFCGFYRQQAFWMVLICIIIFVVFTGASASVVRAGVMGIITLLAYQIGRVSRIGTLLIVTATGMVIINPYVIVWDAGFQLSFLSTLGLVYLSPLVKKLLPLKILGKVGEVFIENLHTTFAAIIMTLPLILYQFGRLSIVAPLVNVLILWIIPWLMLYSVSNSCFVYMATFWI
jgi:competence protein ComEC